MAALYDINGNYAGEDNNGPGVRSTNSIDNNKSVTSTPPKAPAAPSKNKYLGLCAALNQLEQEKVKEGTVEIANVYEIQFAPDTLKASKLKIPGQTVKSLTPTQMDRTAKAVLDPNTNSMNTQGLNRSIVAGTQIVQFIEMVMRNSSYITDQQLYIVDPISGDAKPNPLSNKNKPMTWFKISMQATPIGTKIDTKRNDFAYKITYIISTYQINEAQSQWFPPAQLKGVHKVYNYWFTGENTQVLHYEQDFNAFYQDIIAGTVPSVAENYASISNQIQWTNRKVPATATAQSSQGAPNGANNPASSMADFLYSQNDQQTVNLKIVGDPAWILQGEIVGLSALNFNFQGFYPDGTINSDSGQAVFVINWNAPTDYNNGPSGPYSGTGLMDINSGGTNGNSNNLAKAQPQATAAYACLSVKSTFSKGKFEQEIQGALIKNLSDQQMAAYQTGDQGRPAQPAATPAAGTRAPATNTETSSISSADQLNPNKWPQEISDSKVNPSDSANPISNLPTQAADQAEAPTSEGVVVGNAKPNPLSPPDAGNAATTDEIRAIQSVQRNLSQVGGQQTVQEAALAVAQYNTQSQPMAAKDA